VSGLEDSMDMVDRAERAAEARRAVASLSGRGVVAVALTWVDNSGITRVKGVPLARLEHAAQWGVGASPVFDTFLFDDSLVCGRFAGGPVGDLRLHPDLGRLTVLTGQPGWAWAPANRYDQDGNAHPQDSRALAGRQVERLAAQGLSVRAAFEVEWCVSAGAGDEFVPACCGPAYGMTRLVELSDYLRDLLDALAAEGVPVEQIHPEYADGQFEVSVAAEDPVGAADTAVLVRETIRAVSAGRGLRATFAPKVLADGVGNGGHVHLSIWRDGVNVMAGGTGPYGLTPTGESFIGGILSRLPALLAVGAPTVASYLRLIPSHWAGAFACWGRENREAAIRFITGTAGNRGYEANVEIKCFDAAANPYLVMAALLGAGGAGLTERATLPEPIETDPASVDPNQLAARGVAPLPGTLAESVAAMESDRVLAETLGEEMIDTLTAVRRGEIALLDGADPAEIAARTRWRY
jgi:glutamine synthetase